MSNTKICRGPLHPHGTVLPLTREFFYRYQRKARDGRAACLCWAPCCKGCSREKHRMRRATNTGWTLLNPQCRWAVRELIGRIGISEAGRRSGLSPTTLRKMRTDDGTRRFHRGAVAKMLNTLRQVRATGEMRHRDSVRYGATERREVAVKGWKRVTDGAEIAPHTRTPGRERKAMRVSQQSGPVFPEIEALERDLDAQRKREQRAAIARQREHDDRLEELVGY